MRRWLVSAVLLLGAASSEAAELRRFELDDSRVIYGEVRSSQAEGMAVWTPQGEAYVSYENLVDMIEIPLETFRQQPDWLVFATGPSDVLAKLGKAFVEMEGMAPFNARAVMGEQGAADVSACADDAPCLARLLDLDPWMWLVIAREQDGKLVLEGWIGGRTESPVTQVEVAQQDDAGIKEGLYEVMGLVPLDAAGREMIDELQGRNQEPESSPESPVVVTEAPSSDGPPAPAMLPARLTPAKAHALAWLPLPGAPSLAAGDWAGFGLSWAVAAPVGAAWIYGAGAESAALRDQIILGAIGCYATTVAVNHLIAAPRASTPRVAVGIAPMPDGGGQISMAGTF